MARRTPPDSLNPVQETPHFSAYLNRLGEQVRQSRDDGLEAERRGDTTERRVQDSHPIGNRRTDSNEVPGVDSDQADGGDANAAPLHTRISLGKWGYFLAAKLALFWHELIAFHPLENLGFVVFVLLPVPSRFWRAVKFVLAAMLALSLLYYDSWLPPLSRALSRASSLSDFSWAYLFELMTRFVNGYVLGALLLVCAAYWLVSRWLRAGVLIVASMLMIWAMPVFQQAGQSGREVIIGSEVAKSSPDLDSVVQNFFDKEALRTVIFTAPPANAVPFDLVFLHVCSLSWDDVRAVGLEQHPFWQRFDILLTKFNSAASYSGPAAIHLLRANCGQQAHSKMYSPVAANCYLLDGLQASGFESDFALNHKGKFDNFLLQMREHGHITAPLMAQDGLEIAQYAFNNDATNNAPIYDDLSVLNRWINQRKKSSSQRVALFYNTASLHDGNYAPGREAVPNTLKTYKLRLNKFLDEMEAFMQKLDESGKRTVVVMVPEHGGAVRGDSKQIAGLREIPTPGITLVPVGVRVVGGAIRRTGDPLRDDRPTSFLAIAHIVERMLEKSPFAAAGFAPADYVRDLPVTEFVAQNENTTVLEYEHLYRISHGQGEWQDYTEFNAPVTHQ